MKTFSFYLKGFLLAALIVSRLPAAEAPLHQPPETVAFKDLATGKQVPLASFKGKVVVVDFWATWCEPCKEEIPGYIKLQEKYGAAGLVIIGVSVDTKKPAAIKKFVADHGMNYQIALGTVDDVDAFTGTAGADVMIPMTFLFDRTGKLVHKKAGVMPTAEYEELIKRAL